MVCKVVIFGIDNFSKKNIHQCNALNPEDYGFDIFTCDSRGDSLNNISMVTSSANNLFTLSHKFLPRVLQVLKYLYTNSRDIVHAEIYPGGRLSFFYLIASKMFKIPTIIVERGDVVDMNVYPLLTKLSMKICYRYSDIVWYRETYMKRKLESLGSKEILFIHNALPKVEITNSSFNKDYTFLWVNRFIRQRRSDWFIDILVSETPIDYKHAILGIQHNINHGSDVYTSQCNVVNKSLANIKLKGFINPVEYYLHSKFFVLPSEIVFCNNSLIEAMAHGVVPLVSDVEGARLIVEDGVDGIVFDHSYEGLKMAMKRALTLSPHEYEAMSKKSIEKIRSKYSLDSWKEKMLSMYKEVESFH